MWRPVARGRPCIQCAATAARQDTLNFGFVGLRESDYEWITRQLVKVANTHANGRIVSVLEGGYRVHVSSGCCPPGVRG